MDRPPFDALRAAFWIVGLILASYILIAFSVLGFCVAFGGQEIVAGRFKCDPDNRVFELLSQALSAALAFCGGYATKGMGDRK